MYKFITPILTKFKIWLLVLFSVFAITTCAQTAAARTAHVTYGVPSGSNLTVAILVSQTPNFSKTLRAGQQITGAEDLKHLGYVNIPGLLPLHKYYFVAVGWDKNGNRTPFSKSIAYTIPPFKPYVVQALPSISSDGGTITLTIKLLGEH